MKLLRRSFLEPFMFFFTPYMFEKVKKKFLFLLLFFFCNSLLASCFTDELLVFYDTVLGFEQMNDLLGVYDYENEDGSQEKIALTKKNNLFYLEYCLDSSDKQQMNFIASAIPNQNDLYVMSFPEVLSLGEYGEIENGFLLMQLEGNEIRMWIIVGEENVVKDRLSPELFDYNKGYPVELMKNFLLKHALAVALTNKPTWELTKKRYQTDLSCS